MPLIEKNLNFIQTLFTFVGSKEQMKALKQNIFNIRILAFTAIVGLLLAFSAHGQSMTEEASNKVNEKAKVEIFPNPTSDFLNIDLTKLDLQKPQLEIRSIIGTKMSVNVEENGKQKYKVDVQSFPRGYYLVLVRDDRSKFQQTIRFSKK